MTLYDPSMDPTAAQAPFSVPRRRPAVVTLSGLLLLVGALLGLASAILLLARTAAIANDFRDNAIGTGATPTEIDDLATGVEAGFIVTGVIGIVLAVVVGLLAVGVLRGNNVARITTLVLIGVSVCCGLGTSGTTVSLGSGNTSLRLQDMDEQTARNLGEALGQAVPPWLSSSISGMFCLQVLVYIAVFILLLLPASNQFFRKVTAPAWQPPTAMPSGPSVPYGGQPSIPAAPPAPPAQQAPPVTPAPPGQPPAAPPPAAPPPAAPPAPPTSYPEPPPPQTPPPSAPSGPNL